MDKLVGLSKDARKQAMERFRLLQPHLEHHEPLTAVAQAAGIPYRTAHRLVGEYRRSGLAALVHKPRADRGDRRVVSVNLKEAIEGLALQKPPLPIAAVYRQVRKLSVARGEKAPSYGTVDVVGLVEVLVEPRLGKDHLVELQLPRGHAGTRLRVN